MAKETEKNEGPSCACGKDGLYAAVLKQVEKDKNEASDSSTSNQADNNNSSVDPSDKSDNQVEEPYPLPPV